MDKIINFTNCKRAHVTYGGTDRKFGVIYNDEVYLLKFSKKHSKQTDISTSYVNNAISEYISSHIAQSTGLLVHETVLGTFEDEIVVGCKDFRNRNDSTNIEFSEYVRAKYDSSEIKRFIMLNQIYDTLQDPKNEIPKTLQKASVERYWDTFVIDALVGNFNRNTDNWGFIFENNQLKLAPIYGFGSSLFPEISDDGAELLLNNKTEMAKKCLVFPSPSLSIANGKVGYYDMMSSNYDSNCTKAVLRMTPRINIEKINDIVDNTPFISDIRKAFYKDILSLRNEMIVTQSYVKCQLNEFDNDAKERLQTGHQFSEQKLNN